MCQHLQCGRSCETEEESSVLNLTIRLFHRVKYYVSIRTKKVYGGTEVQFYALTSVQGDWLISSPGRFTRAGKSSRYPLNKRLREPQFLSGRFEEDIYMLLQSGFEPRSLGFPTSGLVTVKTTLFRLLSCSVPELQCLPFH